MLAKLGGQALSLGPDGSGADVTTLDDAYESWMAEADANYAILRPDFYTAATAKTPEDLAKCLDILAESLGLTAA